MQWALYLWDTQRPRLSSRYEQALMAPLISPSTTRVAEDGSSFDLSKGYCNILKDALALYDRLPWHVMQHVQISLAVASFVIAFMGISIVVGSLKLKSRWLKLRTVNLVPALMQAVVVALFFVLDARRRTMTLSRHGMSSAEQLQATVAACASHPNFPHPRFSSAHDYHFARTGFNVNGLVVFISAIISLGLLIRIPFIGNEPPAPPPPPSDEDFAKLSALPRGSFFK